MKAMVIAATAGLFVFPSAALAQSRDSTGQTRPAARPAPSATRATATNAPAAASETSEMTAEMRAAQNNPRIIGSAAWWRIHATADGQRIQAAQPAQPASTQPRRQPR